MVIRLTVEFQDHLQNGNPDLRGIVQRLQHSIGSDSHVNMDETELRYDNESTFSGIDSFCSVSAAYSVLIGATESKIEWGVVSVLALKELFVAIYREFDAEVDFVKKCRLLLDLFKIQIVFAGVTHDG